MEDVRELIQRLNSGAELRLEETENYQAIAIHEWALQPPADNSSHALLVRLAAEIVSNHHDPWLADFLHSDPAPEANGFLRSAIELNHSGEADRALMRASLAEHLYAAKHNDAGTLRARFEQLYALRRLSRAGDCLHSAGVLPRLESRRYAWLEIQTALELSSCSVMKGQPELSRRLGERALEEASLARYNNLLLRALALRGNLDAHEGRSRALWNEDLSALELFWSGTYPSERGFQLYHDLQFDSESKELNYSALLLQRETLAMITGQGRLDFEAMAHFRMAEIAGRLGNLEQEKNELESYKKVLEQLPDRSEAKLLYTAYCNIGVARLAMHSGDQVQATSVLKAAGEALESRDNLALKLEYMSTKADLARVASDSSSEEAFLRKIIDIGESQAEKLKLSSDRWHWLQLLDRSHRRMLELILAKPHLPTETFAFWHQWRLLQTAQGVKTGTGPIQPGRMISFAVLSRSVVVWVVNNREIYEYLLPVDADAVREEARVFYQLCSDPTSNIEKVNASGSRLYQMLIAPLERNLGEAGRIVIATDSYLNLIPWAALRAPSGQYWGETHSFTLLTGVPQRQAQASQHKPLQRMLIATPGATTVNGTTYLPVLKAEEEGAVVASFFPRARRLRAGQSSASRIRTELKHAEGLHFVGHAITRQQGGELITDDDDQYPFLTAGMLRTTEMPRLRLVVLSACSTAAPENGAEGDPGGLVQAFVGAGVATVVASGWDVDSSSTAELMKVFYRQMATTAQPDEALASASRSLVASSRFRHPYYWSAFQVFSPN